MSLTLEQRIEDLENRTTIRENTGAMIRALSGRIINLESANQSKEIQELKNTIQRRDELIKAQEKKISELVEDIETLKQQNNVANKIISENEFEPSLTETEEKPSDLIENIDDGVDSDEHDHSGCTS